MISADKSARPRAGDSYHKRSPQRRPDRQKQNPFYDQAKMLADTMWEDAMSLSDILAPDSPADQEPLDDSDAWMVLESAATIMSPHFWDDPAALEDLLQLRQKFAPHMVDPALKVRVGYLKKVQKNTPDVTITPANEKFAEQMRRLKQ